MINKKIKTGTPLTLCLYIAFNPLDQLGNSAVDARFVGPPTAFSPAHHSCQPPRPSGRFTYQGSTTVSLKKWTSRYSSSHVSHVPILWQQHTVWICVRQVYRLFISPDRSPPLRSWSRHKSCGELGSSRRHLAGSRWTGLLLLPEPVVALLTHSLNRAEKAMRGWSCWSNQTEQFSRMKVCFVVI